MPNKYERVFHGYETTIDSNLQYDIYKESVISPHYIR